MGVSHSSTKWVRIALSSFTGRPGALSEASAFLWGHTLSEASAFGGAFGTRQEDSFPILTTHSFFSACFQVGERRRGDEVCVWVWGSWKGSPS